MYTPGVSGTEIKIKMQHKEYQSFFQLKQATSCIANYNIRSITFSTEENIYN